MKRLRELLSIAWLVLVLAAVPSVRAQSDYNPYGIDILPSAPTAGQEFIVRWDAPDCVDIREARSATLIGPRLLMVVEYIEPLPGLPGCTGALRRHEWTIGPFPAGDYTFELRGIHPFFNERTGELGMFPLTIRPFFASAPSVVPAGTVTGWLLLSLMLGLFALFFMCERRRA